MTSMFEEHLEEPIDEATPQGLTHIGFIGGNRDGHFALAQLYSEQWGTTATFAKERILDGERPVNTLKRCLLEQYRSPSLESVYPVPRVWATPNSTTFYFAGFVNNHTDHWKTSKAWFNWVSPERGVELLQSSKNAISRQRDLAVLDMVSGICLSPHHRILLMLRELHKMGFEQLRAPAYDYPIAWRCPIVPAAWTFKQHGGRFHDPRAGLSPLPALRPTENNKWQYVYSSAYRQKPFDWQDVPFATPRELAERFIREFPEIAICGWGPDGEYVAWFERLIELLRPYHLFAAFGEYFYPDDHIPGPNGSRIPLPPPGHTDEREVADFVTRFSLNKSE